MGVPTERKLFILYFADDSVILAEDEMNIDYMLRKLDEVYIKWWFTINTLKTEHLVVGSQANDLQLRTHVIRDTETFKYLGVKFIATRGSNEEICWRIVQARAATIQLNSLLWNNRITKNNKIRIESIGLNRQSCGKLLRKTRKKLKQWIWIIAIVGSQKKWIKFTNILNQKGIDKNTEW